MARSSPGVLEKRHGEGAPERIVLRHDVTTLGRSESCSVVIPSPLVSRLHARIELEHDSYVIFDSGSANGTFVNGERIAAGYQLRTGDEIWLGTREICFDFSDPEETLMALPSIPAAPITIDTRGRIVKVYDQPVQLSPLEYDLLLHFASHSGTVCTRAASYLAVWGQPYDQATCEDALNACVAKLRRNLRHAAATAGQPPPAITTIQRIGFRLDTPVRFISRVEDPDPATQVEQGA